MIFVAVGSQLAFDRLIKSVDTWSGCSTCEVIAQIGSGGDYIPVNLQSYESCKASEFAEYCNEAEVIVAHAGMGVILSARENGVPLIIMPRRADLNEHRNDHQLATAKNFGSMEGIYVANSTEELHAYLDNRSELVGTISNEKASKELVERICLFIDEGR